MQIKTWLLLEAYGKLPSTNNNGTIADPYNLPFSYNWHTIGYPMSMICMLFESQYATFY